MASGVDGDIRSESHVDAMIDEPNAAKPAIRKGWRGRAGARGFLKRLERARERELERVRVDQNVENIAAAFECRPVRKIKPRLAKLDRLIEKTRRKTE